MSLKDLTKSTILWGNVAGFNAARLGAFEGIAERLARYRKTEAHERILKAARSIRITPTFESLLFLQDEIAAVGYEIEGIYELRDYVDNEIALVRHRFTKGNDWALVIGSYISYILFHTVLACNDPFRNYQFSFTSMFIIMSYFILFSGVGRWMVEYLIRSHRNMEHWLIFDETFVNDLATNLIFSIPLLIGLMILRAG